MEFSSQDRGTLLMDLVEFPSSKDVSVSPSLNAIGGEEQNSRDEGKNRKMDLGFISSSSAAFGLDIGCDFRQHSSSSGRSSVSASPAFTTGLSSFSQFSSFIPSQLTGPNRSIGQINNAIDASSPSAISSGADSPQQSRASSKSNTNVSQKNFEIGWPPNLDNDFNRATSPTSLLSDMNERKGSGVASEQEDNWNEFGPKNCQYCHRPYRQPRLLFCLHSFCEDCIVAMLEGRPDNAPTNALDVELEPTDIIASKPPPGVVRCPTCKQDSNVGNDLRFVQLLTLDYIMINMQDTDAMSQAQLSCESCKAKDPAVAHCFDCSSFLCPNCVKAHQYMRCFENHKVLTFDQIKESGDELMIHKPILCQEHQGEQLRYFCTTCRLPICAKCIHVSHKAPEHLHEEVGQEMETKLRRDLEQLVKEGKQKVQACEGAGRELNEKVNIVNERAEAAVQAVEKAYNAYLEMLACRREELLREVEREHVRVESEIMNTFGRIGNMSEKINDALSFTERLLRCGNAMEILHTRKTVLDQLTCLIRGIPSTNVAINLRFITDSQQFERALKENFGVVRTEIEPAPIQNVNVEELLKAINYANINENQSHTSMVDNHSTRPQNLGSMVSSNSFSGINSSAFMTVPSARADGNILQSHMGDDASMMNKYSHMAMTGNMDYYGQINGHQGGGYFGTTNTHSTNSANISPTSQVNLARPPSCASLSAASHPLNVSSPIDSLGYSFPVQNASGQSLYGTATATGMLPNLSMPPPNSKLQSIQRKSSPTMYDSLTQGQFSTGFGALTVQPGLMGMGGSTNGLTPPIRSTQMAPMQIKTRFGLLGQGQSQFNSPHGFCLNEIEEIAVADTNNHRVQVFSLDGELRLAFGAPGKDEGQLWYPRKIAYLRGNNVSPGRYIVCDRGSERSRMQIFSRAGHFIKKIAIRYIDIVAGLAIDSECRIVAVDSVTPTVFCISENGDLIRWFDCAEYMREPSDIAVSGNEYFICDFKGHCVCVFSDQGNFLRRVGCEGITNFPNGIDVSDAGDVLIGDSHGNRFHVAVYRKNGELTGDFECPYAKVSRCCGLRITRDGFIVTLAKNNHNVLVLNTLFVT